MKKIKIAIIGSGISGLSSAYYLSKYFKVDLFEKNNYFGGHTHTQTVNDGRKNINVDTGFIVFNKINYPNLCSLFDELNVKSNSSDMSFAFYSQNDGMEYSGTNLSTIFTQKRRLFDPKFLKMLLEIVKFNLNATKHMKNFSEYTIEDYLNKEEYSEYFKNKHLYPIAASIWSSSLSDIKRYPFEKLVIFFKNHGLLRVFNRPKWRTVSGGSKNYVEKILESKNLSSYKNCSVKIKNIKNKKIYINFKNKIKIYDHLIIATHADQVAKILSFDKKIEAIFENIKYTKNKVFLHSDERLMPKSKKAWSSWNYIDHGKNNQIFVTYWMNLLQKLDTKKNFFVSLNPDIIPQRNKIFSRQVYDHPLFDFKIFNNQKKIEKIQGIKNIWFVGAYLGFGFHEDGISSALKVVKKIVKD